MSEASEYPPGYPAEWEADVLLTDGGTARLRPIRPDDAQRLVAFYERVSPESKFLRFFAPYPRLSDSDVARFTQVDYVDRVALILTLGEQLIGVGRFDRVDDEEAEVAFLVEDAHQGRGIAQLLLEHLADAARERGITKFVAEVLPQNRRMAQVFADAGYRVRKGMADGVLLVEFPILPTNTSVGVMERREHRAEAASVRRLLNPRRVVVLGPGARVQELVRSMIGGGYRGDVVAVSTDDTTVSSPPAAAAADEVSTARSIATAEDPIDLALVAVATTQLGEAVIDAAHKGAHGIVVLTGTRSGGGEERTIVALARAYGIRAIGPDALGLINTDPAVVLNATPGPMPRRGGVGLFCQSAAVGVSLLSLSVRNNVGLSSFVSTGEFADVTGNDVMQYWEDDEATRVCLLSLDSLGNPRKFSRITRRLARRKPVVVVAPGRMHRATHLGVRGGLTHSPEPAVEALFRQAGVMVVHRRRAMVDIAKLCARQPLPTGPAVRLITNSWTLGRQLAQTISAVGLLPAGAPTVLAPEGAADEFAALALESMGDPRCDAVVCAAVGVFDANTGSIHAALEKVAGQASKPLLAVLLDFAPVEHEQSEPDRPGELPVFDSPGDAIAALAAVSAYAHWRARDPGAVPLLQTDPEAARRVVHRVLSVAPRGRELTDDEATELLRAYGIEAVPRFVVHSLAEAVEVAERLGWNVVLKASAEAVRGRPDLASVYRNLDDAAELGEAWQDLTRLVGELGLPVAADLAVAVPVVQKMTPPGVALVVGSREDAAFGPIVSLGLDGIASELLDDVVYRVPPLTTADAASMVAELKAAPVLFGRNGSPGVDVPAVQDLLHRVAELANDLPQVAGLTLSPCVASTTGVRVLGARVHLAPTADVRDPMARTL